jgi:pimeloyl-ACP methyl ester carboxylesterase
LRRCVLASRFDPRPLLTRLTIPVLWVYGALDKSQPVMKDVRVLTPLRRAGKHFTVKVFAHANHALFVSRTGNYWENPAPELTPRLQSTLRRWIVATV